LVVALLLAVGLQPVLAQDADPVLSGEDLDALIAAAEAEGQVVVYSFTSRISRVETAFEAAYPGIDLVPFDYFLHRTDRPYYQ
jgi:iron(III) transport system substrate-binding protein